MTSVQEPVAPTVVHVVIPETNAPGPLTIENVIGVPAGALLKVVPSGAVFTCPVRVWFEPAGFVAVGGLIWMFASGKIHTFCASGLSPGRPSPVWRCSTTP